MKTHYARKNNPNVTLCGLVETNSTIPHEKYAGCKHCRRLKHRSRQIRRLADFRGIMQELKEQRADVQAWVGHEEASTQRPLAVDEIPIRLQEQPRPVPVQWTNRLRWDPRTWDPTSPVAWSRRWAKYAK